MVSIIIPILNEVHTIEKLLQHLIDSVEVSDSISDIIIVDGGSTDGSQEIVAKYSATIDHIQLMTSERGRANQMNIGALHAKGTILYFLHADSFPPKHFDTAIIHEVYQGNNAGCFSMRFDTSHWWLRLVGWLTQFKSRACRGGDQSQFITTSLFNELGGYDTSFVIYEDHDLINKLYAKKQFVVIQQWLTTSARRYEIHGVWTLQYHFLVIYLKKWFGASAEELHHYYKKHIST